MALPGDYYLDKLEHMLDWVRTHQGALIDAELAGWIHRFEQMPRPARRLLVRLIQRRGPHFRTDLLDYAEVPDTDAAVLALALGGFVRFCVEPRLRASMLRVPELRAALLVRGVRAPLAARRDPLLALLFEALADAPLDPDSVADSASDSMWGASAMIPLPVPALPQVIELGCGDALDCLRLLYFGTLRQDLTEFILADLGTLRWPRVTLSTQLPFASAAQVRRTLSLHRAARLVSELWHETGRGTEQLPASVLDELAGLLAEPCADGHGESRRTRALMRLAEMHAHAGRRRHELHLLRTIDTPSARERTCRLLARSGRLRAAEGLRLRIGERAETRAEASFAARFDVSRARCRPQPRTGSSIGFGLLRLPRAPADVRVESRVVATLTARGNRALHMENRLPGMLFALGFWDIVFTPLPGAFVQPFQSGPNDLYGGDFRNRRSVDIERRLAAIANGDYELEDFLAVRDRHQGTVNAFWGWHAPEVRAAGALIASIPPHVRALICDLVATDPARAHAGFPDLTVGNGSEGCYEFIEVKGPGDQLREHQRAWLDDLIAGGAHARVLEVRYA